MHEPPKQQVKYLHTRVQGCGVTYILKEFSLARIMSDAELASTLCDSVWVVVSCQSVRSHPYKWAKELGPFACSHTAEIIICPSSKWPSKYTWRAMSTTKGFTSRWGSHKKHIEWVFWIKHVHHPGQKHNKGVFFLSVVMCLMWFMVYWHSYGRTLCMRRWKYEKFPWKEIVGLWKAHIFNHW